MTVIMSRLNNGLMYLKGGFMNFIRSLYDQLVYKLPFFVNDGWFGMDKIGHFSRHAISTLIGAGLGCSVLGIIFYDTLWDLLYEYMNYTKGIGFSVRDVIYGRAGMLFVLVVLYELWLI
jgi:hypothetical protein